MLNRAQPLTQPPLLQPSFFPERLRPVRTVRRRPRRLTLPWLLPLVVLLLPLGWWRVEQVQLQACAGVPPSVSRTLQALTGTPVLALDLRWVQQQVAQWPGMAAVAVSLELPATLVVQARPAEIAGSVAIAGGWHAVSPDGQLGISLAAPRLPVLEQLEMADPAALRQGLAVAARLQQASSGAEVQVLRVRKVMPGDLVIHLRAFGDPGELVVHVGEQATKAEQVWCARLAKGRRPAPWTDLRWQDRMVIRGSG